MEYDLQCLLNSRGEFDAQPDYLRINNTELESPVVAEHIIEHFDLRRRGALQPEAQPSLVGEHEPAILSAPERNSEFGAVASCSAARVS